MNNNVIIVKLIQSGARADERCLDKGSTVQDLFDVCKREIGNQEIMIDGDVVSGSHVLKDEDRIFIGKKSKGNSDSEECEFVAKIILFGSTKIDSFDYEKGDTLGDLIDKFDDSQRDKYLKSDGTDAFEYRFNDDTSNVVTRDTKLPIDKPKVRIFASKKAKQN